jgi:hypothetical protein
VSLLESAMLLSNEMQDKITKNVASTQYPQVEFIGTCMTGDRSVPLPSNEEVGTSTDRSLHLSALTRLIENTEPYGSSSSTI